LFGRKPGLLLNDGSGRKIRLKELGERIFEKLRAVAALMDGVDGDGRYLRCVGQEQRKLYDMTLLPSSKIVNEMQKNRESFLDFGIRYASKGVFENEYNRLQRA
jgi:glutamate--cysteine ligase